MNDSSAEPSQVELLAEEFLDRQQRGEKPSIREYCARYPELAEEIRDVFEGLAMLEDLKPGSQDQSMLKAGADPVAIPVEQIGNYRVLREIGRGGMGIVYEAEQETLGRRVALKVLPNQLGKDDKLRERFQREAKAAARLHHTNIVPVFEVGAENDTFYYAMQLIKGQGLDLVIEELQRMRSEQSGNPNHGANESAKNDSAAVLPKGLAQSLVTGEFRQEDFSSSGSPVFQSPSAQDALTIDSNRVSLSELPRSPASKASSSAVLPDQSELSSAETNRPRYFQSVARMGVQTAEALAYAHSHGIVHRDIKPSNLLLDATGVVWITDFGLAKTDDQAITHTGDILGTIRYMSPERFEGKCDERADVYALGLTLYELLILKPAFSSPDRMTLIRMVTDTDPEAPRSLDPNIPRDLETIVLKAIAREPRHRYQTAAEMADDLKRFVDDRPIKARRISLAERFLRWSRRNKALASMMTAIGLLLVTFSVASLVAAGNFKSIAADKSAALTRETKARNDADAAAAAEKTAKEKAVEQRDLAEERRKELAYREYVAGMHFARGLWEDGKVNQLKRLLADYIPTPGSKEKDLRQFEWYHWWRSVHLHKHSIRFNGPASRAAIIPDRNLLIVPSYPGKITVMDINTTDKQRKPIKKVLDAFRWREHPPYVSKDGRELFCIAKWDKKLVIIRFDTQKWARIPDKTIELPNDVVAFAVSPTERHIAVAEQQRKDGRESTTTIHILTMDGKPVAQLPQLEPQLSPQIKAHPGGFQHTLGTTVNDMAFSPDGNTLLVGYDRGMARARCFLKDPSKLDWQLVKGPTTSVWGGLWKRQAVAAIAYSPDGKQLATCGFDGVRLWDPETFKPVEPVHLLPTPAPLTSVRFSPSGNRIAACGSRDQAAFVWSINPEVEWHYFGLGAPAVIRGHARRVADIAFPSDDELWTIGSDGNARLWMDQCQRVDARPVQVVSEKADLYFHPTRNLLIFSWKASQKPGNAWLISQDDLYKVKGVTKKPSTVVFGGRGTRIINGKWMVAWTPEDKKLRVWNLATEKTVGEWDVEDIEDRKLTISRDGKTVAWGHAAKRVGKSRTPPEITVLSVSRGSKPKSFKYWTEFGFVGWMRLSPDGKRLAVQGFRATDLLDVSGEFPKKIRRLRDLGTDNCGEFSPDGKLLAVGSWISDIRIHDGRTGEPIRNLRGHSGGVRCLAFSADGKTLVSGGADGTVRLWDPWRGELRTTLSQHDDWVESVAISPDGRAVASHGTDHALRLWRGAADTDDELSAEAIGGYYLGQGIGKFVSLLYGEALKDFQKADAFLPKESPERHTALFRLAILNFHFGNMEEYRRLCGEITATFADTQDLRIMERTVKFCTFSGVKQSPEVMEVVSRFTKAIADHIDQKGIKSGAKGLPPRFLFLSQGIAQYRLGNDAEAIRLLKQSFDLFYSNGAENRKIPLRVTCRYYLALAAHRAGQHQFAKDQFANAMGGMVLIDDDDNRAAIAENWIVLESARREAEKVFPTDAVHLGFRHRANSYMHTGRFREALADYERAVQHLPKSFEHHDAAFRLGFLLAHYDRTEDYKNHCRKIAKQYADTKSIIIMERTNKMCLFTDVDPPKEVTDITARFYKHIAANLDREAKQNKLVKKLRNFIHQAQGIAAYRRGDYPIAKDWFEKSNSLTTGKAHGGKSARSLNRFFLAMIAQRENRRADAKLHLGKATEEMARINGAGQSLLKTDWLVLQRVRAEAEALIIRK